MDSISGTSGFRHLEIKYVWSCHACGAEHSRTFRGWPNTPPQLPSVPDGWLVLTRNLHGTTTDVYCPAHKIVVQNNEVHVYDKETVDA